MQEIEEEHSLKTYYVSAYSGENINDGFQELGQLIKNKYFD